MVFVVHTTPRNVFLNVAQTFSVGLVVLTSKKPLGHSETKNELPGTSKTDQPPKIHERIHQTDYRLFIFVMEIVNTENVG